MTRLTHKIVCCDCIEVMKEMESNSIDLIITDPPYGINAEKGTSGFGESKKTVRKYNDTWTNPKKEWFDGILRASKKAIIFGGNYFTNYLPLGRHWIVWDKTGNIRFNNPFSKCELAWTNINKKMVEKYTYIQQGFISKETLGKHPTQKPVPLIRDILVDYSISTDLILDPFLGSGTTLIAAEITGRNSIGIEISKKYCEVSYEGLLHEVRQGKMDRETSIIERVGF